MGTKLRANSLPFPCAAVTARLVNATGVAGQVSGRLELLWQGSWVPVCRSGLNNIAATVVCKQVRCSPAHVLAAAVCRVKKSSNAAL